MSEMPKTPRFTGHFAYTKASLTEMAWAILPLQTKMIFPACGVLAFVSGLYRLFDNPYGSTALYVLACILMLLSVLCFVRLPLYTKKYAQRTLKRMDEVGHHEMETHIQLNEENLIATGKYSNDSDETTYDHIIRLQETKHLLLLWRPQKMFYPIEKTKLEGGSVEEMKAFLKEQNPDIRMR